MTTPGQLKTVLEQSIPVLSPLVGVEIVSKGGKKSVRHDDEVFLTFGTGDRTTLVRSDSIG